MHDRPIERHQPSGVRISANTATSPWRLLLAAAWVELRSFLPLRTI